jgi:hypothetical protein
MQVRVGSIFKELRQVTKVLKRNAQSEAGAYSTWNASWDNLPDM